MDHPIAQSWRRSLFSSRNQGLASLARQEEKTEGAGSFRFSFAWRVGEETGIGATYVFCISYDSVHRPCRSGLEIRLQCRTAGQKCTASRGRPQNKALLRLKFNPPPKLAREVEPPMKKNGEDDYASDSVGASSLSYILL